MAGQRRRSGYEGVRPDVTRVTQGHVQPGAVVVLRGLLITEARRGPVESGVDVLWNPDIPTRGEDWLRELDPPGRVDRAHPHVAVVMVRRRGRTRAPSRLAWTDKREGEHRDDRETMHRLSDDDLRTDRSRGFIQASLGA